MICCNHIFEYDVSLEQEICIKCGECNQDIVADMHFFDEKKSSKIYVSKADTIFKDFLFNLSYKDKDLLIDRLKSSIENQKFEDQKIDIQIFIQIIIDFLKERQDFSLDLDYIRKNLEISKRKFKNIKKYINIGKFGKFVNHNILRESSYKSKCEPTKKTCQKIINAKKQNYTVYDSLFDSIILPHKLSGKCIDTIKKFHAENFKKFDTDKDSILVALFVTVYKNKIPINDFCLKTNLISTPTLRKLLKKLYM